jgi:hydrogenase maturation factor HypF (carbamoyltransferase family)
MIERELLTCEICNREFYDEWNSKQIYANKKCIQCAAGHKIIPNTDDKKIWRKKSE